MVYIVWVVSQIILTVFYAIEAGSSSEPIMFTTRDSFLELPRWDSARTGNLTLEIRTNEPNGVLVYNNGIYNGAGQSSDFFAFELLDGQIYVLLNLGSGSVKVKATARRIDDGNWHTIFLRRTARDGRIVIDDSGIDFRSPGTSNQLDLDGAFFLGGVSTHQTHISKTISHTLPPELWSGSLKYGYVGCVRNLVINGNPIDLIAYAKTQDSGSVKPECNTSMKQCEKDNQCLNGGVCVEGWNRFICDCSMTSFTGPVCAKESTTLSFNGEQYMNIILSEESRTQAEYVYIRFKTTRANGLILTTSSNDKSMSHLTISLDSSHAKVSINFGEGTKIANIGHGLNDDQWHSIKIDRRGPSIEIKLDKDTHLAEITGQLITLRIDSIHIGAYVHNIKTHEQTSAHTHTKDVPNFVGTMQNFIMNGNEYFEMARDGQLSNLKVTAKFGKKERIVHHAVTFKSKYTFIGLPQLKAYSTVNLYFQFKTLESNGMLLYNAGKDQDFIAIELVNGHLHYLFNLGDGPKKVRSNTRTTLNDNRWHSVTIGRPSIRQHTLMVDDMLATVTTTGSNFHLDLDGLLYLGGVRTEMYDLLPKVVQSNHGFEGCLASLELNDQTFNPSGSEVLIPSTLVAKGCAGTVTKCSNTACANRGICVKMWNSYTCDCDMTTFTGPTCADGNESIAYKFGEKNGLITFTFANDKRPDTKNDLLALGFITTNENAVLVRIDSGSSNDYMELGLTNGNPLMVYNLGTEDIEIGEMRVKVNDGMYHIVRFIRSGQNSTIQVDNHNVVTKTPSGRQLTIFNTHSKVQIGGKKNTVRDKVEKPFVGVMSGFVFNGHRLLDMAVEDDSRVTVEGDVQLIMSIGDNNKLNQNRNSNHSLGLDNSHNKTNFVHSVPQMAQPKSQLGFDGDDLIFSGEGSGCWDDEDECNNGAQNGGSGDDLITPVYISSSKPVTEIPTHFRITTDTHIESRHKLCDDEEEDCFDGSGSGETSVSSTTSSSIKHDIQPHNHNHRYTTTWTPMPSTLIPLPPYVSQLPLWTFHPITVISYDTVYHTQRPVSTSASKSEAPTYEISGSTRYPTNRPHNVPQQSLPPIYIIPKIGETPKVVGLEEKSSGERVPNSSSDRTAMIIGVIAIALIIVVIIAPILLFIKVKYRTGGTYKIDENIHIPVVSALSSTSPIHSGMSMSTGLQQTHLNINGNNSKTSPQSQHNKPILKLPKKKNLKEWYV